MFEFEVDHSHLRSDHLPAEIIQQFSEGHDRISRLALLPWEEHCTECAMPECYQTCDLYAPRKDGKCRRFVEGIEVLAGVPNCLGYVVRVSFKRWAQLMCYANLHLVETPRARKVLKYHIALSELVASIPDAALNIRGRRGISSRLARRAKIGLFNGGLLASSHERPDLFVCEIYNPSEMSVNLTLVLRSKDEPLRGRPYQRLIVASPGFHRICVPYGDISPHLHPQKDFTIVLGPNILTPEQEGTELYFGLLSFVKAEWAPVAAKRAAAGNSAGKTVKIAVWDLDNTLWDGILVEDGPDKVRLRPDMAGIIRELDRRGIVNSVVSKNDFDPAWQRIKDFGLDEYFVFPKISWGPKGEAVRATIEDFNVGADTVVVIDDSPFERFEVQTANPSVRVMDPAECDGLLDKPEFSPPASDEALLRRQYYRNEESRQQFRTRVAGGDYRDFLRQCEIRICVVRADPSNVARAHELIQRTNQLNFSGNRYSREQVEQLISDPTKLALCISARDRFGDYGMVGFSVLEKGVTPRLADLMLSCRVQAKRVEHAFLVHLLNLCREGGARHFEALYRKTERNKQAGQVFDDLGFSCKPPEGNLYRFEYDLSFPVAEDGIIAIEAQDQVNVS